MNMSIYATNGENDAYFYCSMSADCTQSLMYCTNGISYCNTSTDITDACNGACDTYTMNTSLSLSPTFEPTFLPTINPTFLPTIGNTSALNITTDATNFITADVLYLVCSIVIGLTLIFCFGRWFSYYCERRGVKREKYLLALRRGLNNEHDKQLSSLGMGGKSVASDTATAVGNDSLDVEHMRSQIKLNVVVSDMDAEGRDNESSDSSEIGTDEDYDDEKQLVVDIPPIIMRNVNSLSNQSTIIHDTMPTSSTVVLTNNSNAITNILVKKHDGDGGGGVGDVVDEMIVKRGRSRSKSKSKKHRRGNSMPKKKKHGSMGKKSSSVSAKKVKKSNRGKSTIVLSATEKQKQKKLKARQMKKLRKGKKKKKSKNRVRNNSAHKNENSGSLSVKKKKKKVSISVTVESVGTKGMDIRESDEGSSYSSSTTEESNY